MSDEIWTGIAPMWTPLSHTEWLMIMHYRDVPHAEDACPLCGLNTLLADQATRLHELTPPF